MACSALAAATSLDEIRSLRLEGELSAALDRAETVLAKNSVDPDVRLRVHLELARIHDRIGLHTNTRPVEAALLHMRSAETIAGDLDEHAKAQVELALAEYFYRAEMPQRLFERASEHAVTASRMLHALGDHHGEAEAVHRLGLIALQKRELELAEEYFDESLRLDRLGGERKFFRGEYERHVGFVKYLGGDAAASLPYFERSLDCRIRAGAIDASMFAAISLGATLVELRRFAAARINLRYALTIAARIDSTEGRARAQRVIERLPPEYALSQDAKQTTEIAVACRCPSGLR